MDYSLLVGVTRKSFDVLGDGDTSSVPHQRRSTSRHFHDESSSTPTGSGSGRSTGSGNMEEDVFLRDEDGGMHAVVVHGPATYYFGIIDILQQWNWRKKLERYVKMFIFRHDGDGLSAMEPRGYTARFMSRCVDDVFENLHLDASSEDIVPIKASRHGRVSLTRESSATRLSIADNPLLYGHRRQSWVPGAVTSYVLEESGVEEHYPDDSYDIKKLRPDSNHSFSNGEEKVDEEKVEQEEEEQREEGDSSEQRDKNPKWGKEISQDV